MLEPKKLNRIKDIVTTINFFGWLIGGIAFISLLFVHYYNEYIILITIIYPIIPSYAIPYYNGFIGIHETKEENNSPSVFQTIVLPCCSVGLYGMIKGINTLLESFAIYWVTFLCLILSLPLLSSILMLYKNNLIKSETDKQSSIALIFLIIFWSYGTVINLNDIYDNSKPKIYQVEVLDKEFDKSHIDWYRFEVSGFLKYNQTQEISIYSELYEETKIGDSVNVYVKEGFLDIPWYYVRANK